MRSADGIAQDQAVLQRGLDVLERMAQRMEEGGLIEIYDIRTVLRFLRAYGDSYHLSTEERELLSEVEGALNPKHGIGFVRNSRRLILLLRNHREKEMDEMIGATLTGRNLTEIQASFARLEWKYAPKSRGVPSELDRRAHA
jgi:hypothetical protein